MTREKRELLKQLEQIDIQEHCELSMDGSGELGSRICDTFDEQRRPILERLNTLMHGRVNDYFCACVI